MNTKKILYLIMAVLGLVGEVFACATYARDVSDYDAMLELGYSYDHLPFTTHETLITLVAIVAGLALAAGVVLFFGNDQKKAKAFCSSLDIFFLNSLWQTAH